MAGRAVLRPVPFSVFFCLRHGTGQGEGLKRGRVRFVLAWDERHDSIRLNNGRRSVLVDNGNENGPSCSCTVFRAVKNGTESGTRRVSSEPKTARRVYPPSLRLGEDREHSSENYFPAGDVHLATKLRVADQESSMGFRQIWGRMGCSRNGPRFGSRRRNLLLTRACISLQSQQCERIVSMRLLKYINVCSICAVVRLRNSRAMPFPLLDPGLHGTPYSLSSATRREVPCVKANEE